MEKYICNICGYIYDPKKGDPNNGVAVETPWKNVAKYWCCPVCGVGKNSFSKNT